METAGGCRMKKNQRLNSRVQDKACENRSKEENSEIEVKRR